MPRKRAAGRQMRVQHRRRPLAQPQVGEADDARATASGRKPPLALIAATPFTNSVSPTGRSASGPLAR